MKLQKSALELLEGNGEGRKLLSWHQQFAVQQPLSFNLSDECFCSICKISVLKWGHTAHYLPARRLLRPIRQMSCTDTHSYAAVWPWCLDDLLIFKVSKVSTAVDMLQATLSCSKYFQLTVHRHFINSQSCITSQTQLLLFETLFPLPPPQTWHSSPNVKTQTSLGNVRWDPAWD